MTCASTNTATRPTTRSTTRASPAPRILVAGVNFGCGSSREHAPQSLRKFGFNGVIAESFAEIFFGNSTTLAMPCVIASAADIVNLRAAIEADPATTVTIDVDTPARPHFRRLGLPGHHAGVRPRGPGVRPLGSDPGTLEPRSRHRRQGPRIALCVTPDRCIPPPASIADGAILTLSWPPQKPNLDSVTTINDDGSRYFLHPADVTGRWVLARRLIGALLIAIYVLLPWIPINGNPAVFLDVEHRMFHLFGLTLVPQDLWVMFFAISGLGFALFFVTSLLGRIWCGWACPYTVFLDHVYRRIERWIEGDAPARRALDNAPWTPAKIFKRIVKHLLFAAISACIAHVFLSYFVSWRRLYGFMHEGPLQHATAFGIIAFLTLVLWFCFGYFREQFCIIMCPYGRLQGALTDDDTINVGYDEIRGEPRGTKGKTEGDCIDCRRCVQVCPTGIDIRNGLQLECIGCTACIDACDDVMTKIGRPRGLIRYDSFNGFAGKTHRFLRPRVYRLLRACRTRVGGAHPGGQAKSAAVQCHRFAFGRERVLQRRGFDPQHLYDPFHQQAQPRVHGHHPPWQGHSGRLSVERRGTNIRRRRAR